MKFSLEAYWNHGPVIQLRILWRIFVIQPTKTVDFWSLNIPHISAFGMTFFYWWGCDISPIWKLRKRLGWA